MACATRHQLRRNLENVAADEGDEIGTSPVEDPQRRNASYHRQRHQPPEPSRQSGYFHDALDNRTSLLSRFLFLGEGDDHDGGGGAGRRSWFLTFCRDSGDKGNDMPSIGSWGVFYYALALEPREKRNERIIMLFEAFAIFGALLMNAVWIIYEWGSQKGYGGGSGNPWIIEWGSQGGYAYEGGDSINSTVNYLFECVMAIAFGCDISFTVLAATLWLATIGSNSSHEDHAFESMKPIVYLAKLFLLTVYMIWVGLILGMYSNLSPNWIGYAISIPIFVAIWIRGSVVCYQFSWATLPLEVYHLPLSMRCVFPKYWQKKGREDLQARAKLRAQELAKRACREREKMDSGFETRKGNASPLGFLLSKAAANLHRADCDTSAYETRLEEDWFNKVDDLRDMSVDFLARYMPYNLAKEVHQLVKAEDSD